MKNEICLKNIKLLSAILFFLSAGLIVKAQTPGNAISLNGSTQYVNCGNGTVNITGSAITLEAWINASSSGWIDNGSIINKENGGGDGGYTIRAGASANKNIKFALWLSGGTKEISSPANSIVPGRWHHICGTYNGSALYLYIDGNQVATTTGSGIVLPASVNMWIGNSQAFTARNFPGSVDEVRIWNDARTQAEIQENMFTELTPANEANLVAYYKCNESTGSATLTDSKSSNTGTVNGSPTFPYSYAWMGGTYTVNPAGTGHDNFTTFASSVTALNATNLSGSVVFSVKDDATFAETANQTITTTGTVSKTITFQRSNDGTNKPKLQFTGTNGTTDACIQLNSSDYMTFNGLEIQPNGTSGSNFVEYGIFLNAAGATDGCQYNTIKNCDIKFGGGGTTNTASTTGIYLDNIATSAAGANSYNLFYSNKIDKATHGYLLLGTIGYNDFDNRISIIDGGTASLTDLGYGGNASATYGIEYQYQTTVYISYQLISFRSASITAATSYIAGIHSTGGTTVNTGMIYNNTISGLTANDNVPVSGICLEANSDCSIFNNTIQGIVNQTTGSNLVCGIKVNYGSCKIYNNMISQLTAPAIPARAVSGIELSSGTSNPMVYFNTVYLDYASTNASNQSAALYTAHTGSLDLRNNIFINKSVMTTGTRAVAFYASAAGAPGLTTASNNNLYYAGTPGTKNLIFYNGTAYQTLTDYQALWPSSPKREQLSVTENNTPFTSTSGTYNLHIPNGSSTLASAGGGVIIGYTTDIDGATRNATNPDIGADEFLTPQITVSPATLAFGPVNAGNTSASQPYTLNGADLSADVTITAPTKYMVSLDNSAFSTTLTVPVTNTNTGAKVVYVRFAPTSYGNFPGNVSNVSGSTTCNVAVSGTCVDPACTQNAAATNLTFENITHNSIKVAGITAASGASGYVIYVNSANTFTAPVTGTNPGVNSTWANAGQQAIYIGNLPANANVTGLTTLTTYYFKVYAYKSCNDVLSFESTGLSGSATTKGAPIYVRYNATGTANGTSWTNAYTSLQSALDAATASSQIWMAKGQYYPSKTSWGSTTPYDPRDKTFFLNKSVSIYGGFAGTETSTDQRSNYGNGGVNETILDGNISDPANATDNIYQIIKIPLSASPNLDGLSVKNSYSSYYNGGGIIFEGINYSGTNTSVVSNCYFSNNTAQLGSAVYVIVYTDNSKCLAQFRNCLFESNTGNGGVNGNGQGAIYLKTENSSNLAETSPVFTNCIIRGNTNSNGGGVCLVSQGGLLSPKFFNCLITGNLARFGGAILAWKISGTFSPNFVNSTLSANTDTYYTGGIYIIGTSTPLVLNNCVVWNNKTGSYIGTAAANIRGSGLTTTNSLVQGFNTGGTNLNGITNMGNSNYPGFTTPIDMSTAVLPITSGDFHLTDYAPVIDKGNTAYLNLPPTQLADLEGEERIQNGGLDLGPYEGGIACIAPVINVQPIAAAKFEGETVIFTVGASGTNPVYQWKKNGTTIINGSNISGATTASLTLTDLVLTDAGTYSCAATGTCGSATSNGAMLTVDAACVNPAITSQPSGAAKKLNESVTFSVTATGTNLLYQWEKAGTTISGANSASYTISNLAFADAATYTCYISNACNNVTSTGAVLTVSQADQAITFNAFGTVSYGDNDITPDATASSNLSVSFASSNTSVATIVDNALHIVGVGTSTITASQAGDDNYNAATNATQLLTVGKGTAALTLSNLLQAHDGSAKSVTVTTDPASLTTVGVTYNGSATPPTAIGSYTVVATLTNSLYQGTATGTLQITCTPVMADQLQSSYYITEGQAFSVTTSVVGSPTITYQWKKGGTDIGSANSATYTIPSVSSGNVGIYTCYISNGCGNVTTNDATLNVVLAEPTSATATPSTIYNGGSSNLTAISAGNQVRWYNAPVEGTLLGTVNSGVNFSVSPTETTTYYAGAYNSGANINASETRASVTVTVTDVTDTWTGVTSHDWNTPTNWSTNLVPTSSANVAIPDVTNDPIVNQDPASFARCNNMIIEAGGVVTIAPGKALTVNGTLINNTGNAGLVINSATEGTGSLIHNSDNVPAIVKIYITGSTNLEEKKFHLVSIPAKAINPTSGLFLGSYLYKLDATQQEASNSYYYGKWVGLGTSTATPINLNQGYMVYWPLNTPGTNTFYGNLNNGDFSCAVTGHTGTYTFNLVPNPYSSAVNWGAAAGWTKSAGIGGTCYVWGSNAGNYEYIQLNSPTGIIPIGQAFIVMVSNEASPILTVKNAARVHSAQAFYKSTEEINNQLSIKADANGYSDVTRVAFNAGASEDFDLQTDGLKMFGLEDAPQLYTLSVNQKYSINSLPELNGDKSVPMNFETTYGGDVTLAFSGMESFPATLALKLEDKLTNQLINLRQQPTYTFAHLPANANDRFVLHFGSATGIGEPQTSEGNIWISGKTVNINSPASVGETAQVEIFNAAGQMVFSKQITLSSITQVPTSLYGFAVVRVSTDKNVWVAKGLF
ncbi:MAG: LamG-like jellyroll fold domain-containing protein [Bacteroidota bacterium]